MAEPNDKIDAGKVQAAEDDARFRARLKEEYGIEDDAPTFKTRRERWQKAESEIPQYEATLDQVIRHYKQLEEAVKTQAPEKAENKTIDEEKIRQIAKLDPYEGIKRVLSERDKQWEARLAAERENLSQGTNRAVLHRETLRRSREIVEENWPEAFDQNTDLYKMGHRIFNQEMSEGEKQDPRAFLIATERAAGRLGLPPKTRRKSSTPRREQVASQNVSRQAAPRPDDNEEEAPLTARQKKIAEGVGVSEKAYREARKLRAAQSKKQDDE